MIFPTIKSALRGNRRGLGGFTLVEMLVVIAIMAILSVLVAVSFAGILSASYDSELANLAGFLTRARAYAIANNSYVYVGIEEIDSTQPSTAVPQKAVQTSANAGGGAIAVAAIATSDGSRGYDPTDLTLGQIDSITVPNNPAFTTATPIVVSPVQVFNNLHIIYCTPSKNNPSGLTIPTGSKLTLDSLPPYGKVLNLGDPTALAGNGGAGGASSLTFNWPPGVAAGTPKYTFSQVIQFNPQGEAQIINGPNVDGLLQYIEMDLEPMHGLAVPNPQNPNNAAIIIDGVSGSIRIFRT